uniref:Uncharacterized protein n=1 Tax=Caenorhabditis japonica TaxID=281687 RepID=A0A8R1IN61_CAEJA
MQPIPLFPIRAGYSAGILATRFHIPTYVLMYILALLVGFKISCLSVCFLRKHQAIAKIDNKYLMAPTVYNGLVFYLYAYTLSFSLLLYLSGQPKTEEWKIIDSVRNNEYIIIIKSQGICGY